MLTTLLFDFSRTLLFAKDRGYAGGINVLHKNLAKEVEFRFFDHFELNIEILDFLSKKKDKYTLGILTSDTIQNVPEVRTKLDPIFSHIYSGKEIGLSKTDKAIYNFVARDLNKEPNEILFVDDSPDNIAAAREAGFQTLQYVTNERFFEKIKELLA